MAQKCRFVADIGPGDGPTVLVPGTAERNVFLPPACTSKSTFNQDRLGTSIGNSWGKTFLSAGSHKALFEHPSHREHGGSMTTEGSLVEGAEEMYASTS